MWLLAENVFEALMERRQRVSLTAEEKERFENERVEASRRGSSAREGTTAVVQVEGILTRKPDIFAWLFGGGNTTYEGIIDQLRAAEADDGIDGIVFDINSPGGHVDGLFDAITAIELMSKPMRVRAADAQSAAYALATAIGPIEATSAGSTFGSVGVVQSLLQRDDVVTLTNTESPNKRPDVSTPEGRAQIVRHLDAIHDLVVESIAGHRDITVEAVNERFGRGATLLAREAQAKGMIDGIAGPSLRVVGTTNAPASRGAEGKTMNLEQLKAEHPALYAAVLEQGKAAGIAEERERCIGHLLVGEKANALHIAVKAIREGTGMTFGIQAEYMAAMADRQDVSNREADDKQTGDALSGVKDPENNDSRETLGAAVADKVDEILGISTRGEEGARA